MSTFTQLDKIAKFIYSKPVLKAVFVPAASAFTNLAGYRKMGLKFDDLIIEENDVVQKALKRLPARESYDRIFRIATAQQLSLSHKLLPKHEQVTPEQDKSYLIPYILEAEAEANERKELDNIVVARK
ncbi:cytochrome b-c1 complex subunit 7 [Trichomonascus vanleenenianus]|uniref:ubiquinol--cytochrome-c reductase subunit 7 n=1 Tax=Trichomonascus vanleenenianus TaxID=2268995 RepID=UPI003EC9B57B